MTTQISQLEVGKVRFQGMVEVVRDKKNIQFIILKDFSGKIQVTVDKVRAFYLFVHRRTWHAFQI
jgi:aspartyl/asparaginyl-tRNA synthetase